MSQRPDEVGLEVEVKLEDLLGPLGYSKREDIEPAILEQILRDSEQCRQATQGRAMFTRVEILRRGSSSVIETPIGTIKDETLANSLNGARSLAVAVCTIGDAIDKIVDERFERGDFLGGMIADVYGSRAVEDVAERCGVMICSQARSRGLSPSDQLSPGYGRWDVRGQRVVFSLLDPSPIGVTLNEHCMMRPKKSVSFVFPLVEGESVWEGERLCARCGFKNCSYRRV